MIPLFELFLFRHGETDWNREGRFQGHTDVPLNETGRSQAERLIKPLKSQGLEAILASDLSRARETGEIVARALGIPVFTDPGLREAHLGKAQGMTGAEIEVAFGAEFLGAWRSPDPTDADVSYPGGESGTQVISRVFRSMEEFLLRNSYERIGVATHGGVIRRVAQTILPPETPQVPIPNGILYRLSFDRDSRIWSFENHTPLRLSNR